MFAREMPAHVARRAYLTGRLCVGRGQNARALGLPDLLSARCIIAWLLNKPLQDSRAVGFLVMACERESQ